MQHLNMYLVQSLIPVQTLILVQSLILVQTCIFRKEGHWQCGLVSKKYLEPTCDTDTSMYAGAFDPFADCLIFFSRLHL